MVACDLDNSQAMGPNSWTHWGDTKDLEPTGLDCCGRQTIPAQEQGGINLNVFELGPKLIKDAIYKDWHDNLAEDLAKQQGLPAGERLDFDHARMHLQSKSSSLSEQEKAIATNFFVGGTWDVP